MGLLLWIIMPVAIALLALPWPRKGLHAINIGASVLLAGVGVYLTRLVILNGAVFYAMPFNLFFLDPVSIILLDLVLIIGLLTSIYTVGYLETEILEGQMKSGQVRPLYMLIQTFILTMVLALSVRNMGVMWIAIEATTLASVFLVGFHNGKVALEAAWKYIIICSVGITVAMLGIIFIHTAASGVLNNADSLDWTALFDNAGRLDGSVLRFAFLFILIGFGTKAGLAPMHTWLPDAHSQAPSPVSALLSGVLLNSAMYAIIRTVAIVNKSLGNSTFTGWLLICAGVLSIATAAIIILTQKDYKRLLAYSSIEHMGLIALAVGIFTPASLFAAFFHMINHSLTKSMLFLSSGTILQKYGTRETRKIGDLIKLLPVTGPVFLLGLIAIGGTPPFGVFASEFNILASVFKSGKYLLGTAIAVLIALVFAGIISVLFRMFYQRENSGATGLVPGEDNRFGAAAIVLLLAAIAVTGLYMPSAMKDLLLAAQRIISGG